MIFPHDANLTKIILKKKFGSIFVIMNYEANIRLRMYPTYLCDIEKANDFTHAISRLGCLGKWLY